MHEMSLCRALLATAEQHLAEHPDLPVTLLRVRVGALSGCEPDLLQHLFAHAAAGSRFAQAQLVIDFQPACIACQACGRSSEVPPNRFACPHCGSLAVQLTAGEGVYLSGISLGEQYVS